LLWVQVELKAQLSTSSLIVMTVDSTVGLLCLLAAYCCTKMQDLAGCCGSKNRLLVCVDCALVIQKREDLVESRPMMCQWNIACRSWQAHKVILHSYIGTPESHCRSAVTSDRNLLVWPEVTQACGMACHGTHQGGTCDHPSTPDYPQPIHQSADSGWGSRASAYLPQKPPCVLMLSWCLLLAPYIKHKRPTIDKLLIIYDQCACIDPHLVSSMLLSAPLVWFPTNQDY
jgi:hypothetical protein